MTPQFPHPFFLALWVWTVLNPLAGLAFQWQQPAKTGFSVAIQNLACVWIYCTEIEVSVQSNTRNVIDEAMISWQVHLKFRTYNPGKITKYGVLVRMVCEAVWGYICNMEIYSTEGKKLEDTVLSLVDRNLGQNHRIRQDNFYNSVRLAQTLLGRNVRVCGTMRANKGIPRDLEGEASTWKKSSQHSGEKMT